MFRASITAVLTALPPWLALKLGPYHFAKANQVVPVFALLYAFVGFSIMVGWVFGDEAWKSLDPNRLWKHPIWTAYDVDPSTVPRSTIEKDAQALLQLTKAAAVGGMFVAIAGAFAVAYLQLSHASHGCFHQALTHTQAGYFSIATMTTTGFGDLHPYSKGCQAWASIQMLAAVASIAVIIAGLVARLLEHSAPSPPRPARIPPRLRRRRGR